MSGILMLNNRNYTATGNLRLGGDGKPLFTSTVLCDNSSASSSLVLSDDYHNYNFIEFELTNSSSGVVTKILTTPDAIDAIFDLTTIIVLNEFNNNQYVGYSYNSAAYTFSRQYNRNCDCTKITGYVCSNLTVTETEIFKASSLSSASVSISSTGLLEYDFLIVAANNSDSTSIIPCNNVVSYSDVPIDRYGYAFNGYNSTQYVSVTDTTMSSAPYLYVGGIKFS